MSGTTTAVRLALGQISKVASHPGTASTAIVGNAVVGEIVAANSIGDQSTIYIPIFGEAGIDSGVVGYTSVAVGYIAAFGALAAASVGAPLAAGAALLATGVAAIAVVVNPSIQASFFEIIDQLRDHFDESSSVHVFEESVTNDFLGQFIKVDDQGIAWVDPTCRSAFDNSQKFVPRVDPLTLDLDNDGLETVATSPTKPILFDHNGDGVKTSTGWVKPDDGFLVFDRNGNGVIDNGTELFGDSTALYTGGKAADGFTALAQEDNNLDGKVDSQDAHWMQLKVWRDLNQDGTSQSGELFSMDQAGIASFNVAMTENSHVLTNGNQIADLGSFVRTNGMTGTMGEVSQMADINLVEDTYYRQFSDKIALADGVASLPDMHGSGKVRDLREAASMSPGLKDLLTQFSQAASRQEQRVILGQLLEMWADTSDMAGSMGERAAGHYSVSFQAIGSQSRAGFASADWSGIVDAWERKMHVLEAFNGRYFFRLPNEDAVGNAAVQGLTVIPASGSGSSGTAQINVALSQGQTALLNQSYDALFQSIYVGLNMQTRFKPLLDEIGLVFSETGVNLDFSAVEQHFHDAVKADAVNGLADLIDFNRGLKEMMPVKDWHGAAIMAQYMTTLPHTADLLAMYTQTGVRVLGQGGVSGSGSADDDIIVADAAGSSIYGNEGNDVLVGRTGDDRLSGDAGNDVLAGGTGNDNLDGGTGNDTYVLARGDGVDTIYEYDPATANTDVAQFTDVASTEVTSVERKGNDLLLKYGETDQLTVTRYFDPNYSGFRVEQFSFSDGVIWDDAAIKARAITNGSTSFDYITGYDDGANRIYGLDGNDLLYGGSKADIVDGGNGNDTLYGRAGDDLLYGGAGSDQLNGEEGNDLLVGGTGNDNLDGGTGNDTYVLVRGDGVDTIYEYDPTPGNTDVAQFTDVTSTEVTSVERKGNDLLLKYGETDQLTVTRYFDPNYSGCRIEQFSFSDGVVLDDAAIKSQAITNGSASNDYITGYNDGANRIYGLDGNDLLYGASKADIVDGGSGNDTLYGRAGHDALYGGAGSDQLNGEEGNDLLEGGSGNDSLWGGTGNDIINGGDGNDTLYGDDGDDLLDAGAGDDLLYGGNGADTIRFGKGYGSDVFRSVNSAGYQLDTVDLFDIRSAEVDYVRLNNDLEIRVHGSSDKLTLGDYFSASDSATTVRQLQFADGVTMDNLAIKGLAVLAGDSSDNMITGFNDGPNRIYGLGGNDTLTGGSGNDFIDGGDGNDTLSGGTGNELFIGGSGDDFISTGSGYDIIAFNKGDGRDTVAASTGRDNTLSLGGGISDVDLLFSRSANDLVLATGGSEQITFRDWYAGTGNHSVANLQITAEAGAGDDAVVFAQFDFNALAGRFDEAQAADPAITRWALTSSMMAFHLGSSDAAALGGELAYQYASHGDVTGLSTSLGQSQLGSAQFGVSNQAVNSGLALLDTASRLI